MAEVDDEHLIQRVVNDVDEHLFQFGQFAGVELAEENGELDVVAALEADIEHFVAPLVAVLVGGDVVTDEIMSAGGHEVRWIAMIDWRRAVSQRVVTLV